MGKKLQQNRLKHKFTRTSTKEGGTMKIFGDELNPCIPYKTFLLSINDTAEWIVKEMLCKYGLKYEDPINHCLLQIILPSYNQMDNKSIKEVILHDKECPLHVYLNHIQKNQGSIIFKIIRSPVEYIEVRKRLYAQELALKISQIPTIEDRTINDQRPMLIEVNYDGTDLLTPRICKLHSNTTYVGRDTRAATNKQYLFIDGSTIDRDHCIIENQNGLVRLIPRGEVSLNGKVVSIPFTLQHGALICFGRNILFRYVDPRIAQKIKRIRIENPVKSSVYSSAPVLSAKTNIQQKKTSPVNATDPGAKIDVLPGLLDVPTETEIRFLRAVFADYPLTDIHFRLFPAYTLYMTLRYRLSPYGNTNISFIQKQKDVRSFLYRIEDMFNKKIEECQHHGDYLAYWLANISEFIYFLKEDRDLTKLSSDIQIHLISFTQRLFYYFINLLQNVFDKYLIALINIHSENNLNEPHPPTLDDLLRLLSSILNLLHKCRVNPSLTVQIYSQIFLYINTWLFNRMIGYSDLKLCSSIWGERLSLRLKSIISWAQKQGLEFPSECHLLKVNQLCSLLKSSKRNADDAQQLLTNTSWKMNSIQVKHILKNYILDKNESPIANDFSETLITAAHKYVDENLHRKGLIVQLAEEIDVDVPIILPEDGYTFETLHGIPQQLFQFIESINRSTLCRLLINPHTRGMWTEFMSLSKKEDRDHDRIEKIVLNKRENSFGISIVSATSNSQQYQGIYIKAIVPNGAAEKDGRLQAGDQILRVDRINFIDMTQEKAVEILKQCGDSITLQILKDAANRHGLSTILDPPTEIQQEFTRFPSPLSSSVISNQPAPSTNSLQTLNIYESLLPVQQPLPVQPSTSYTTEPYQSTSGLAYSKQCNNHQRNTESGNFIRSTNRTQSFMTRSTSATRPVIRREDIPPDQNENYRVKSVIAPNMLSKPMVRSSAFTRQANLIHGTDVVNHLSSPMKKQQEPIKLINTYRTNLKDIRRKRIDDLLTKIHRTENEEKELNDLQLDDEFDHRVGEFYSQTNNRQTSTSLANDLDDELRRRLKQFEKDREAERADINRLLAKREAHLHKDQIVSNIQEYDSPPDSNLNDFKTRRMCEEDRRIEQTSLPKYLLRFQ
ncbi:hypothetical protein I4U23_014773 [Adineta vaga]|nr:hypothetical protein I4U23_014773 [Adineta vaga]